MRFVTNNLTNKNKHTLKYLIIALTLVVATGCADTEIINELTVDRSKSPEAQINALADNEVRITVDAADIPYSEIWAKHQGVHPPVPDQIPGDDQHQQSPLRKGLEDGGIILPNGFDLDSGLWHPAEVVAILPSPSNPQYYLMNQHSIVTKKGRSAGGCVFKAGIDAYNSVVLNAGTERPDTLDVRWAITQDNEKIPVFPVGSWVVTKCDTEGQWWPGECSWIKPDGPYAPSFAHTMSVD